MPSGCLRCRSLLSRRQARLPGLARHVTQPVRTDDNATNNVHTRANQHHSTLPVGGTDDNTARGQRGSTKFDASQSFTNGQLRSMTSNWSIVISLFKLTQYCLGSVYAALPPPGPGPGDFVLLREHAFGGIAPRSTSTDGRSSNRSQSARGRPTDKQRKLSSKCGKKHDCGCVQGDCAKLWLPEASVATLNCLQ